MKAVVTAELPQEAIARLAALGYEPVVTGWSATHHALDTDELIEALADAELLICEVERVDDAVLSARPELRLVAACRGAPTNVDLGAATRHSVLVLHTPGRNAASVADFTIGLLLACARGIARSEAHLRQNGWSIDGEIPYFHFRGPELQGRVLGLVGFGAVAREVARRASRGFDMHVLAFDPWVHDVPPPYEQTSLHDLLHRSDFVSLHVPLTTETTGMLGRQELAMLSPRAYLLNTARAAVVDEGALRDGLESNAIAGAALDVFWEEPLPRDHWLLRVPNVLITPHVAGAADDVSRHQARMVLDDIERWRLGQTPRHVANPDASLAAPR